MAIFLSFLNGNFIFKQKLKDTMLCYGELHKKLSSFQMVAIS